MQRITAVALSITLLSTSAFAGSALPTGGDVVSGDAIVRQSGDSLTIEQRSERVIANWESFDIGSDSSVVFLQPDKDAVALNRVLGHNPSEILGTLSANGQVFLINPNGVVFGNNAQVDVGALVASTLGISDSDFLNSTYRFEGTGGEIMNRGNLDGAVVALLAPTVRNEGAIAGDTALAAGSTVDLDFDGDGLTAVRVDKGTLAALVENAGVIRSDDGLVVLTAKGALDARSGIVNNSGTIDATGLVKQGGRILLLGDMAVGEVNAGGSLTAGFVETSAAVVDTDGTLKVDTQGGAWLIDPVDIEIAEALAGAIETALESGDVTVSTAGGNSPDTSGGESPGNGDITVKAPIAWSQNILNLRADRDIVIEAELTSTGATGNDGLTLEYAQTDSSGVYLILQPVNLAAGSLYKTKKGANGAWTSYTIIASLGSASSSGDNTLQGIVGDLSGNYALGADLDAAATASWNGGAGFTPIGDESEEFAGAFDGLGHSIKGLTINRTSADRVGLFGSSKGELRNIYLDGGSVKGKENVGSLLGYSSGGPIVNAGASTRVEGTKAVGGLTGRLAASSSSISHSYATGDVIGSDQFIGGLVGHARENTSIKDSHAEGKVSGKWMVGGLVGSDAGTITNSFATGDVAATAHYVGGLVGQTFLSSSLTGVYAEGDVVGKEYIGGLAGTMSGSLTKAYATGSVTGEGKVGGLIGASVQGNVTDTYATGDATGVTGAVGGLIGLMQSTAKVSNSYARGVVDGNTEVGNIGGLVGETNSEASVSDSFYIEVVMDGLPGDNGIGTSLTAEQMQNRATFTDAGWDLAGVWGVKEDVNDGWPGLRAFLTYSVSLGINLGNTVKTYGAGNPGLGSWTVDGCDACISEINWGALITKSTDAGFYGYGIDGVLSVTFADGFSPADYDLAFEQIGGADAGLTVNKATITAVTGITAADKTYDGTTAATLTTSGASFVGIVDGDSLTVSNAIGTFSDKNAGVGKNVSIAGITLGGADVDNYTLQDATAETTATISKATITGVNGITAEDKTYDGNTDATLTFGGVTFAGMPPLALLTDTLTVGSATGTFSDKHAGVGKNVSVTGITLGGADAGNYTLQDKTAETTATISKATITTVTGITAADKTYDGTTAATLTTSGASFVGIVDGDALTVSNAIGLFSDKNAGAGKNVSITGITLGGADVGNYTLQDTTAETTATISKAIITKVTGITAEDKTYDGDTEATLKYGGATFVGMPTAAMITDTLTVGSATGTFGDKNAGVDKTVSITGITLGGADAGNYMLQDKTAETTATISKATITAVTGIVAQDKIYDATIGATLDPSGATFVDIVPGDLLTVSGATGRFIDRDAGRDKPVSITDITLGGADANNYTLADETANAVANISRKLLAIAEIKIDDKSFDGTSAATVLDYGKLAGILIDDHVKLDWAVAQAIFADVLPGLDKNVEITGLALTGSDAHNYELPAVVAAIGNILMIQTPDEPHVPPADVEVDTSVEDRRVSMSVAPTPVDVPLPQMRATLGGVTIEVEGGVNRASLSLTGQTEDLAERAPTSSNLRVYRQDAAGVIPIRNLNVTRQDNTIAVSVRPSEQPGVDFLESGQSDVSVVSDVLNFGDLSVTLVASISDDGVLWITIEGETDVALDENAVILSALALVELELGRDVTTITAAVLQ